MSKFQTATEEKYTDGSGMICDRRWDEMRNEMHWHAMGRNRDGKRAGQGRYGQGDPGRRAATTVKRLMK